VILDAISAGLLVVGAVFFLAGTVGLLRFPDVYTRLHALTKADNVGLGFVVLGLAVRADSAIELAKLGIVWLLVMVSSSLSSQLIARSAHRRGGSERSGPEPRS
jgi:multicomponent Na+:H+ antiporter subunit G